MSLIIHMLDELEKRQKKDGDAQAFVSADSLEGVTPIAAEKKKNLFLIPQLASFSLLLLIVSIYAVDHQKRTLHTLTPSPLPTVFALNEDKSDAAVINIIKPDNKGPSLSAESKVVQESAFKTLENLAQTPPVTAQHVAVLTALQKPFENLLQEMQSEKPAILKDTRIEDYGDVVRLRMLFNKQVKNSLQQLPNHQGIRVIFENTNLNEPLPPLQHNQIPIRGMHALNRDGDLQVDLYFDADTVLQTSLSSVSGKSEFVIDVTKKDEQKHFSQQANAGEYKKSISATGLPELPPIALAPEAKEAISSIEEPKFRITQRGNTQAKAADIRYQAAKDALVLERVGTAEKLLDENLILFPRHVDSLLLLSEIKQKKGNIIEAKHRLQGYFSQHPENQAVKMELAKLLLSQDNVHDALAILETLPPALSQAPEYHALIANLYQRLNMHNQAETLYQKILTHQPQKASLWLGLGMSHDAQGKAKEALQDYQHALTEEGLNKESAQFVNTRIKDLLAQK